MAISNNNEPQPYLSVVVTARNDDHGGNLLGRMQTFVNALLAQARRHVVAVELVVVDWNPPAEKPPLADALRWPADLGPCQVRFVEVPAALHDTFRHGAALPLYQMIAKNVGIRRARGQFVLATNIDVVFSHELFAFFAERRLSRGRMYRIDRHDAMQDVPVDGSIDEQLRYCESHLIRINSRQGSFAVNPLGQRVLEPDDIATPESGITLGQGWYPIEGEPGSRFRWILDDAEICLPPHPAEDSLILDLEPGPGLGYLPFLLQVQGSGGERLQEAVVLHRQQVRIELGANPEPLKLRLHAPGGGLETAHDPRILNFRVFSLRWERSGEHAGGFEPRAGSRPKAGAPSRRAARAIGRPIKASFWRRLRHLFSQLRSGGAPFQVGLPLPGFLVRRLRPQVQSSALVLTLDPAWFRPRRSPAAQASAAQPPAIVAEGLDLLWGRGWYPQETYKGESFRWARNGAELILQTPQGVPPTLRLLIEPGPAVAYEPFHLRVHDAAGNTIATATVNRRQWIDLPLPWRPGRTQLFALAVHSDNPAQVLPNDPRTLCFRVLQCCWAPVEPLEAPAAISPPARPQLGPWTSISTPAGILLGYGWEAEPSAGQGLLWRAGPEAEIIARRGDSREGVLLLEVEPVDAGPLELLVREGERLVANRTLSEREQIRIPVSLQEEQTGMLQLTALEPSAAGPGQRATRPIRLVRASWEPLAGAASPAGPGTAESAAFGEPPLDRGSCGPAFLHTNACGDFTLLAREHWFDLRGYPEFDLFSMNLDSVFCYAAHHGGAPEEMLPEPMRVYHIEHATGSGFTPEGQAKLFERIAAKGLSWLDYEQVLNWAADMRRLERPMIFNGENWGFAGIELTERVISSQAHASASTQSGQPGSAP